MRGTAPRRRTARRPSAVACLAAALLVPAVFAAPGTAQDPGLERLRQELERIAPHSGGTMGIGALHLESGRSVFLNGDGAFPMASTYKVPIAYQLLRRVDREEIRLDTMLAIEERHHHPGSGTLSNLFIQPGVSLSLRNLTELMLLISDNTATDRVLEMAGGGRSVTAAMREAGLAGIRVDRPTLGLIADFVGVTDLPPADRFTLDAYRERVAAVSAAEREAAATRFATDPRDTATPRDMVALLRKIWTDDGLSAESAALLRDIMLRCQTGAGRIRGMLPPHVVVANKTGTIGGTLNDVGVIQLPDGSHVAVAVFIKASLAPNEVRERAVAHSARAVYDYFALHSRD
ncbi:MAG: class A beta-lactamase [Chloroflexi bacterium]|nr:class A beta-lactamase [Chloroflexota bacterium]